ncbi:MULTISPECIES: hypothetical protein [Nostoc]|uniref:Uncharacterized protein n=2 Tax=Nostoc TaxID=1177 RepID=A0ABR8I9D1_9NOSO|nr:MULTISPECIES: hypothetical protein [Nostoc]MBD2561726.1 hypothetical protein [Nostoc linckia FACHB-391]MBD2647372.1 hypothetical protein [Nostoc foliaceum FACHB-393]
MKKLVSNLPSHLILFLVIMAPSVVVSELNQNIPVKEAMNPVDTINFSSSLSEKIQAITGNRQTVAVDPHEPQLLARRPKFRLFDNGPSFVQNQPYQANQQGNRPSALETFQSLIH